LHAPTQLMLKEITVIVKVKVLKKMMIKVRALLTELIKMTVRIVIKKLSERR
jgi:hypothetical protein